MSTSYTSYIVKTIYIVLVWIMLPLRFRYQRVAIYVMMLKSPALIHLSSLTESNMIN